MLKRDARLFRVDVRIGTAPSETFEVSAHDESDAAGLGIDELLTVMYGGKIPHVPLGATITTNVSPVAG